jgi:histone H3/H4
MKSEEINGITKPAISRLVQDAGAQYRPFNIGSLVYEEIRLHLLNYLNDVIISSMAYLDVNRQKTINAEYVLHSLKNIPAAVSSKIKTCKDNIRDDQKTCFHFPKEPFARVVKEIINEYRTEIRVTSSAMHLLQLDAEQFLIKLVGKGVRSMVHASRKTLMPKDIQLFYHDQPDTTVVYPFNPDKTVSLHTYIKQMIHAEADFYPRSQKEVIDQLNTILNIVGQAVIKKADDLVSSGKSKTMTHDTIQFAASIIMKRDDLYKYAHSFAVKTVSQYVNHRPNGNRREVDAGLIMSVSRVENMIRDHSRLKISDNAPVYLASVLEFILQEILKVAADMRDGESTFTGVKLYNAIEMESGSLQDLFNRLSISIVKT